MSEVLRYDPGGGTTESRALPLQVGIVVGWYPSSNRRVSQREVLGERPKPLLLFFARPLNLADVCILRSGVNA